MRRTRFFAVALALTLASCGQSSQQPLFTSTSPGSLAATSTGAAEVMSVIDNLDELMGEWNDNQIDWLVALQDPNVSYDEFVRVQQDVLVRQSSLAGRFDLTVQGLPSDLQSAFEPLTEHMYGRVGLLREVFGAAATGTDQQFSVALSGYQQYIATDALPAIEALFTSPEIDAILTSQGVSGEELVETFRRMLGAATG